MPENSNCPSCSRLLRVSEDLLDQKVKCPACRTRLNATLSPWEPKGLPLTPLP